MGGSPDVPQPTNPNTVAANQQTLNTQAAQKSQEASMVGQNTPTGSLSYSQTGTAADGTPLYTATTQLSTPEQQLLTLLEGTKGTAGSQASQLLTSAAYGTQNPSQVIGDATKGLTGQAVQQEVNYLQPFFKPQQEQLDTQLRNQGFDPTSPAYKQAMNNLMQSQGQTETGFIANIEPQMYQQAYQNFMTPANLAQSLGQFGAPISPSFVQTPQNSTQPADLTGATSSYNQAQMQAYNAQLAQNQAMMSGLFGVPTAVLGGMAKSGGFNSLLGAAALA